MIIHYAAHVGERCARRKFSGLKIFWNFFRKCVDRFVILLYTKQVVRDETTTTDGSLAQLGEHLPYKERVTGWSPVTSTNRKAPKPCGLGAFLIKI